MMCTINYCPMPISPCKMFCRLGGQVQLTDRIFVDRQTRPDHGRLAPGSARGFTGILTTTAMAYALFSEHIISAASVFFLSEIDN